MILAKVQKKLSKIACPSCQSEKTMSAVLRCDLGLKDCLVAIRCEKCTVQFELAGGPKDQQDFDQCPDCHKEPSTSRMFCEISSRKCYFVAEPCEGCRKGNKTEHSIKAA